MNTAHSLLSRTPVGRTLTIAAVTAAMGLVSAVAGCDKKEEAAPTVASKAPAGTPAQTPSQNPVPSSALTPPPVSGTVGGKAAADPVAPAMPSTPTKQGNTKTQVVPKTAAATPKAGAGPATPSTAKPVEAAEPVVPGSNTLEVRDLKLAAGVEQRMPWGIGTVFPTGARKVVAWVRVRNKGEKAFVTLVWTKGGVEIHRANLDVGKSSGWRTWSTKRLSKGDAGTWRVAVLAPNGDELSASEFTVVEGEVVEPVADADKAAKPAANTAPKTGAPVDCRALVVVGGPKGVATVDVRGGATPSMRSRRGVVGYQGRRAYALRIVNVHDELGTSVKRDWQELWSLELPDGRPVKRLGDGSTAKLRIDAVGPEGVALRVIGANKKSSTKTLAIGSSGDTKPSAARPKADKDGWVSLGQRCGSVRPSAQGLEFKVAGSAAGAAPTVEKLPIGAATTLLGVTPLATYARFDLRWMFNQGVHADTLLRKGRKQSREGNFGAAMGTFQEALAFNPSDSTLAGEMAWAALRKGDLVAAEAWGNKARRWSRTARNRASARYNLGRVAEAAGKKTLAIQHYEASLKERRSASVAARVARLRGGAAPSQP